MGDCKIAQKIVLLLQNKETWCRCQWFWGFQRAEGFSKSLGRCTALIFCGFRFALGKRVAWMQSGQQKIGAGWFASGALIAFQRAERFKTLGALHGAVGKNLVRAFVAMQTRSVVATGQSGALQTAFFHIAMAIQSNNRRIKNMRHKIQGEKK
jgi:hypothetical protein